MPNPSVLLAAAFVAGASLLPSGASARALRVDAVEVELVARQAAAVPGQPLQVGLRLRHDPGWHTYWRNPGDSGLPTELSLTLPAGFSAGPIQWPAPERLPVGPLLNFGYDGEIVLPVTVAVPGALAGDRVALRGKAQWLVCKDVCVPGEAEVDLELPVRRDGAAGDSRWASLFDTMAARTPSERLDASAAVEGRTLSIGLPVPPAGRVEFFPYEAGMVDNPGAQRLFALPADAAPARIRLAVPLAEGVDAAALRKAGLFDAPAGVLVIDGVQARELSLRAVAALAAGDALPNASVAAGGQGGTARADGSPATGGGLLGALGTPGASSSAVDPAPLPAAEGVQTLTLIGALLSALVGGLILNLMPCVFPVIGLKVLAFAQHDRDDPAAGRRHAAGFSIGIIVAFWALAALLLGLRAAGQAAGWGFQLQSAGFVVAMALLFVGIGLNLSGVWEFGVALTRLGGLDRGGGSMLSAMASGALAVLVATPCTAPFMGSALGFTLGQPAPLALAVFTAIGLGMALPYLVLGLRPELLSRLPRPGRWMETVRQALAFPMYATAAWLAWVLGQQAGIDAVFGLSAGAVVLAFAAWCHGRFVQRGGAHPVARVVTFAALAGAVALAWPPAGAGDDPADGAVDRAASGAAAGSEAVGAYDLGRPGAAAGDGGPAAIAKAWTPWSEARVREALAQGRPVFVDFTAAWCVSCQVNKRLVLDRESVQRAFDERGVLRLRADWTRRDAAITAELARHGRNGVPLYLLLAPGAAPRALPELLTVDLVRDALTALPAATPR